MLPAMINTRSALLLAGTLGGLLAGLVSVPAQARDRPRRLLFFTKSATYEHAVIKVTDGQPSVAQRTLDELGVKHGFVVTHTKDGSVFTPEGIKDYDGFIFYTSGDLSTPGTDKTPPMPADGKATLLKAIAGGKGFIGIHQATGTFYSAGDRWQANGADADPYIKMIGGEFIQHGVQQQARVSCTDAKFPGLTDCKAPFDLMEEWYSFKNLGKDLHVLLAVETWSLKNVGKDSVYRRPSYPNTWVRREGKGRVFYTGLGHRDDVWASERFQNLLVGGIKWALGQAAADVRPNIAKVTPGFDILPPQDPVAAPPAAAATATAPKATAASAK
jgi:type 1 glutamine amidotransferase